jgi:OFA family oxalate/formate antiporter-like MFS transporter
MSTIRQNKQGLKVLITGSILQLFLGIIYVWSVFVMPVSKFYAWDLGGVKLMTSFMLCFFVVGIFTGGKLQVKIGTQKTILAGGSMLVAGMIASAFLTPATVQLMYFTYGIVGGFGVGTAYNANLSAAQKWFPQNRGFATGVSVCAFGFSTVIFAPLIKQLLEQFEVKNTFLILAAGFFVIVLALFRFIRLPDESAQTGAASAVLFAKRQYTVTETIRTREFYIITLSLMFATSAYFILNPSFITFSIERGFNESIGTAIVMLTGIVNSIGRLTMPMLSDRIGREKAAIIIIVITAISALLLCFAQGLLFIATIAAIAFFFFFYPGIYAVLRADYFGIKNVGSNYGAVMMGFAISALTFPILIEMINDVTTKFVVLAGMATAGIFLMIILMKTKRNE